MSDFTRTLGVKQSTVQKQNKKTTHLQANSYRCIDTQLHRLVDTQCSMSSQPHKSFLSETKFFKSQAKVFTIHVTCFKANWGKINLHEQRRQKLAKDSSWQQGKHTKLLLPPPQCVKKGTGLGSQKRGPIFCIQDTPQLDKLLEATFCHPNNTVDSAVFMFLILSSMP